MTVIRGCSCSASVCLLIAIARNLWLPSPLLLLPLLPVLLLSFLSEAQKSAVAVASSFVAVVACSFVVIPQRSEGICGCLYPL
jgi:hypothetical protein